MNIERFEPRDCFFRWRDNWCPGWAIGSVKLPIAPYDNSFTLVRDYSGEPHWIASHSIHFREDGFYKFEDYGGKIFDWGKIRNFPNIG